MGATLIGGDSDGGTLTLSSTSSAAKGKILLGSSAYDEVNNRLGILTASPSFDIHVLKNSAAPSARIQCENTGGNAFLTSVSSVNTFGAHVQVENTASDNLGGWATLSAFGAGYAETYHFGQEDAGNSVLSAARGGLAIGTLTAKDLCFGTNNAERLRFEDASGLLKVCPGMMTANGSQAMSLGSTGPSDASATPVEWLTIKNSAGQLRRIPCF